MNIDILEQRLERAKAALRSAKQRQKEQEQRRVFDLILRSGLSLADLETMLTNRHGGEPISAPAAAPPGDDFVNGDAQ